jgi:outer membrane protein TolC
MALTSRRGGAVGALMVTAFALVFPATGSGAPPGLVPTDTVALDQVVRTTLSNSTELKVAALRVESAEAAVLAAAAPFDSALDLSAVGTQSRQFSPPTAAMLETTPVQQIGVTGDWSHRFRSAIVVAPEVTTTQTRVLGHPRLEYTKSSAHLKVTVPLWRDLGGTITAAGERSALRDRSASLLDQREATASGLLRAADAYWRYVAATRRLAVLVSSENRAGRTVEDIAALVKADERTRADLAQAQGTLSSRRANRIAAEQDLLATWQTIALLTGMVRDDLGTLPAPVTDFPGAGRPPPEAALPSWLSRANARRPEVAAAQDRIDSEGIKLRATREQLWPALDLEVTGGYSGQQTGPGLGRLADPLFRDIPGPEGSVALRLQLPLERSGARGKLALQAAAYRLALLTRADLDRRIRTGVANAFEAVKRSRLALHESEEAVRLLEQSVDNEKQKFRLGSSILFAVIQAEDSLTSALLAKIEGQRAFATALATARFETGTLIPAGGPDGAAALTARLTELPGEDVERSGD